MRKSYKYEIILYYFQQVLRNSLDPGKDFWLDPGSMNMVRIRNTVQYPLNGAKAILACGKKYGS